MNSVYRRDTDPNAYLRPVSPGCDVVKRGCLYVKRPPTKGTVRLSLKTWQKRYLILQEDWKESGKTTLDIYNRESEAVMTNSKMAAGSLLFASTPYTIDLRSITSVDQYLESRSFVHAIIIIRSDGFPVILGAESELEIKCWMAAIRLLADKASQFVARIHRPPSCPSHLAQEVKKPLKGTLSLSSRLNRSTPHLFKVTSNASFHHSVDQQSLSSTRTMIDGSYIDVLETEMQFSPQTPASADVPECNSFKKNLTNSFFANFSHRETGSKWRPLFSKMNRKDSGFSESFDESCDQFLQSYRPPQDPVEEEDQTPSSSPPPVPPRQLSSPFSPPLQVFGQESFLVSGPPRPPPRPVHTLTLLSH